jgi:hypothetical protein
MILKLCENSINGCDCRNLEVDGTMFLRNSGHHNHYTVTHPEILETTALTSNCLSQNYQFFVNKFTNHVTPAVFRLFGARFSMWDL